METEKRSRLVPRTKEIFNWWLQEKEKMEFGVRRYPN
jgi:hypothetical protein